MPQIDTTTFLPQVFWLTLVFGTLYLIVLKNILPTLTRILKVRSKKLTQGQDLLQTMASETVEAQQQYAKSLGTNLQTSDTMLQNVYANATSWIKTSVQTETSGSSASAQLSALNDKYLKAAADLSSKRTLVANLFSK